MIKPLDSNSCMQGLKNYTLVFLAVYGSFCAQSTKYALHCAQYAIKLHWTEAPLSSGVATIFPVGGHWGALGFRRGALTFWADNPPPKKKKKREKGPHFPVKKLTSKTKTLITFVGDWGRNNHSYKGIKPTFKSMFQLKKYLVRKSKHTLILYDYSKMDISVSVKNTTPPLPLGWFFLVG